MKGKSRSDALFAGGCVVLLFLVGLLMFFAVETSHPKTSEETVVCYGPNGAELFRKKIRASRLYEGGMILTELDGRVTHTTVPCVAESMAK